MNAASWAIVTALVIAAGSGVVSALLGRSRLAISPHDAAAQYRDEIADLERQLADCRERNRSLDERLVRCEDDRRVLKEDLYREQIGHRIAERHLERALTRLAQHEGERDVEGP